MGQISSRGDSASPTAVLLCLYLDVQPIIPVLTVRSVMCEAVAVRANSTNPLWIIGSAIRQTTNTMELQIRSPSTRSKGAASPHASQIPSARHRT